MYHIKVYVEVIQQSKVNLDYYILWLKHSVFKKFYSATYM